MPVNPGTPGQQRAGAAMFNYAIFQWEPLINQHEDMNLSVIPLENPVSSAQFPQPLRIIVRRR